MVDRSSLAHGAIAPTWAHFAATPTVRSLRRPAARFEQQIRGWIFARAVTRGTPHPNPPWFVVVNHGVPSSAKVKHSPSPRVARPINREARHDHILDRVPNRLEEGHLVIP